MKDVFSRVLRVSPTKKEDNRSVESQDYVADAIGTFGPWQAAVCTATVLTRFIVMWNMTSIFFLTPETVFKCVEFKKSPVEEVANSTCYDSCLKYAYSNQGLNTTLISDYGLICEWQWLASFAQSIMMFGILIGTMLFGWISDSCFRFITGMATGGALTIPVVYVMEIIDKDHREAASCYLVQPDGLAQASLAVFALLSPTWNIYILGYSVAAIIILILVLFVPESPRWLISHGRIDEAIDVMTKAAKW
ncbi:unnamed protein product, partial [Iphiclides podalirius]